MEGFANYVQYLLGACKITLTKITLYFLPPDATASAAETVRSGLTLDEAKQILNLEDHRDAEALEKNYQHLFEVNERTKGGSLYLQSKVWNNIHIPVQY